LALLHAVVAYGSGDTPDEPSISIEPRIRSAAAAGSNIRVDSSLVLLPVNVTDARNRLVRGLDKEEFRVFDGKNEHKVLHLSSDDMPLSVGIVFDASGSMANKLPEARAAVAEFLKAANPDDEFFLVSFNDKAELAAPFTHSAADIQNRLITTSAQGRTALLDAVYLALHYIQRAANPRRALLVISDGGDNNSRYCATELRGIVRESDVWIYAIGIYAAGAATLPEEERGGPELLTELTEETGGRQLAVHQASELPDAATRIGQELRNQYILAYSPAFAERDGKYHRVQVKLVGRRNLRLSWRRGYYAPVP
jgi:VWFA-related protein